MMFGAIADAGYLTRREDVARYLGSAGIEPMAAAEALAMLGRLLNQEVAAIAYARVDWAKLTALNPEIEPELDLFRPGMADVPTEAKIDLAMALEQAVKRAAPLPYKGYENVFSRDISAWKAMSAISASTT